MPLLQKSYFDGNVSWAKRKSYVAHMRQTTLLNIWAAAAVKKESGRDFDWPMEDTENTDLQRMNQAWLEILTASKAKIGQNLHAHAFGTAINGI